MRFQFMIVVAKRHSLPLKPWTYESSRDSCEMFAFWSRRFSRMIAGFSPEVFRADLSKALGLPTEFVQDNHSGSVRGVLRGLHFQWEPPMGKLMRVTRGTAFLVAVDIRKGSPTLEVVWQFPLPATMSNRLCGI